MTAPAGHATHGGDTTVCVVVLPVWDQGLVRDHPGATLRRLLTVGLSACRDEADPVGARDMAGQAHRLRGPASGAGGIEIAARRRCFRPEAAGISPQFFDPIELQVLAAAIRDGFTFVDLGANVGVYSLFVAGLAGRKARILAVEPQPEIYRRLAFNVAANDLGTIRTLQCAVADRDGTLDLFIDRGNRGQSSIAMVTGEKVSVPCRTLESVLVEAGFDRVDALKIDIEGAEDTVLAPFFATAPPALWPSLILLETSSDRWKVDCVALCIEHGYRETHRTRLNVILERIPTEDVES
jgi:FkbM family methyltransferase